MNASTELILDLPDSNLVPLGNQLSKAVGLLDPETVHIPDTPILCNDEFTFSLHNCVIESSFLITIRNGAFQHSVQT